MKPIIYVEGDASKPQGEGAMIIAHVCNDIGGWGKGFVLAISKRSKKPEVAFKTWYAGREKNDFGLGSIQLVEIENRLWVANMICQHKITKKGDTGLPPVRYEAIDQALSQLADEAIRLNADVHMPRIGCGLAGGEWPLIEPLIIKNLSEREVQITVYDWK